MNYVADIEKYLRKIDNIIRKKGREILKDFNITTPQFIALQWLITSGDLTIGELSNKMSLACSTITDLIDRMEKNQLVSRVKDNKDRRIVRVKVKKKGHDLIKDVLERRQEYLLEKLRDLDEEKKISLANNLKELHKAMEQEN